MQTKLYLAYGSNLNLAQMRYRCPDARMVGYTYLPNRKLAFRGSQTGNYLTLDEAPGAYPGVPCGVFEISERDQASLDRYEGVSSFLPPRHCPCGTHLGRPYSAGVALDLREGSYGLLDAAWASAGQAKQGLLADLPAGLPGFPL